MEEDYEETLKDLNHQMTHLLRRIEHSPQGFDGRKLALARTNIEQGTLWLTSMFRDKDGE